MKIIPEDAIYDLMSALKGLHSDIVEENKSLTLLEKIDINNLFEPAMNRFVDKMMRDYILGRYF